MVCPTCGNPNVKKRFLVGTNPKTAIVKCDQCIKEVKKKSWGKEK